MNAQVEELIRRGEYAQAERVLEKENSREIESLNYLSFVKSKLGKGTEAIEYAKRAVDLDPMNPDLLANLSLVLIHLKEWTKGEAIARETLKLNPHHRAAADFLGRALLNQNRPQEALEWFEKADQGQEPQAELEFRTGTALMMLGRLSEAEKRLRKAVELFSPYTDAWNNLGVALRYQGKFDEALACYEKAIEIKQDYPDARLNRAMSWLLAGDFERGWPEFEWRFVTHNLLLEKFEQPVWDGSDFRGKTLLIHSEQGFGDAIQLARYFPMIKQRGGTVILDCRPELKRWFEGYDSIDAVSARGEKRPPFDLQLPIFSIPKIFKTRIDTIPAVLSPRFPFEKHQPKTPLRVGIAWAGSKRHMDDRVRSCPMEEFLILKKINGVEIVSLQKDVAQNEFPDVVQNCADFLDTAKVINELDLVIAVDTAVVHLAATLGKPVWLLTAIPPDWRWLLNRSDSPWYPTLKIFRQSQPGDWKSTLTLLYADLIKFINRS